MRKRLLAALLLVLVGAGVATVVWAAFLVPHQATGTVNTAVSGTEALYICQPSGATTDPLCPIDTAGADETIYAASEDLLAGSVEWQKIRVTNVGGEPWDILSMQKSFTEVSDPGGLCNTVPEGVVFADERTELDPTTQPGPGVTILGKNPSTQGGGPLDPVEGVRYGNPFNDNHGQIAGSTTFHAAGASLGFRQSVHVTPGDYEDLLLGIRLPVNTPEDCLNVVWELTTTWTVQVHTP